ncbi:MAG: hypothetical protein V1662_01535 [Candidatus Omnitrophota bacterium]
MVIRVIKAIIGILLIPVAVTVTSAFAAQLARIQEFASLPAYFLKGVIAYLILHVILMKPAYLYVLGHETAHALAAFICGGQVRGFQASSSKGRVLSTKSNFFIALFPYFFPAYTIFFWLVYLVGRVFWDMTAYAPYLMFLIGFSLTLHLVMTIDSLKIKQSDIFKTGYFFSLSLIYILNLLIIGLILGVVFKEFSLPVMVASMLQRAGNIYYGIFAYLFL